MGTYDGSEPNSVDPIAYLESVNDPEAKSADRDKEVSPRPAIFASIPTGDRNKGNKAKQSINQHLAININQGRNT